MSLRRLSFWCSAMIRDTAIFCLLRWEKYFKILRRGCIGMKGNLWFFSSAFCVYVNSGDEMSYSFANVGRITFFTFEFVNDRRAIFTLWLPGKIELSYLPTSLHWVKDIFWCFIERNRSFGLTNITLVEHICFSTVTRIVSINEGW